MRWIWHDLRYGMRGLRKQPGFAATAVGTLALGIGAATTIFSVIHGVLLDPFPYTNAERVVSFYIHDTASREQGGRGFFQAPEYLAYQKQNHVFEEAIGGGNEDVLWFNGEGTEHFDGAYVTPNTFQFLGVPALLGRTTTPDDVKAGAPPVFVMAYKMWSKRFNLDPAILGRTFVLNGTPFTLVGIMPPRFTKRGADLWRPVDPEKPAQTDTRRGFLMQARLKPGVTPRQVEADIAVIAHGLAQVYPQDYPRQIGIIVETWLDSLVGRFRTTLYTLAAAVGLLLLIACGNVANMLLARATAREKEMAIRSSMGAGRGRLIGQLLLESLLLAVGGAVLGCLLSYAGIKALVALIPENSIPHEAVIRLNLPVLLFSLGVAVFTAMLFGLAPATQAARRDLVEPLRDSGKGVSGGFRRGKLRNTLVVLEVALSMILLAGAGLLMRSFVNMQQVDLGMNPHNILVARLPLPRGQYETAAAKQRFFQPLLARLAALPGVVAATETSTLPPYGGIPSEVEIAGKTHPEKWDAVFQLCSEGYFQTLGIRLRRGRGLTEAEVNGAHKSAVVNQTLVTKYFGNEDPIGKPIRLKMLEGLPKNPLRDAVFDIVGVVVDARNRGVQEPPGPEIFIPYTVVGDFERGILVRTAGAPLPMLNAVRREIWAVDHNVALTSTGSLEDYLMQFTYAEPRFSLLLLGVFAAVGLVLVITGVYSVIAYTVSRQTHEIGIRMALGAGQASVFGMVLRMGVRLIAFGVAAGLLATFGVTRVLASQLWSVSPHDPLTLGGVVTLVALAGLAACYFPARRATQVDPTVALRYG